MSRSSPERQIRRFAPESHPAVVLAWVLGTILLWPATSEGQPISCDSQKVVPADPGWHGNRSLGTAAAVDGPYAIAGAPGSWTTLCSPGDARIFAFDGFVWTQETILDASDGADGDHFGAAVAISGAVALVGAYQDDTYRGSAYIFRLVAGEWVEEAKLTASDAQAYDRFGFSVALSGDVALVGAYLGNDPTGATTGAAYVYRFDGAGWGEEAKLTATDAAEDEWFGYSVSVSGDVAMVGAPEDDDGGSDGSVSVFRFDGVSWVPEPKLTSTAAAGLGLSTALSGDLVLFGADESAHVYRFDGVAWIEEAELTASDASPQDRFGYAVSLSGELALVGARSDDDSGSAYLFRHDGSQWVEEAKLLAAEGSPGDRFGHGVGISGNVVMVGAPEILGPGATHVFEFDGSEWSETEAFGLGFGGVNEFGESVALWSDVALIGAPGHYQLSAGSAFVSRRAGNSWIEEQILTASDGEPSDSFGASVAVTGEIALVGSPGADSPIVDFSGASYVYRFDGTSWNEEVKLTASDAETGARFGDAVALSGDMAVVGAPLAGTVGAVHVFRFDGNQWSEEQKLTASDSAQGDLFGYSVAVSADLVLVGAHGNDDRGFGSGSAYVFRFDGSSWVEEAKLTASNAGEQDAFGLSVGLSGECIVIGAPGTDPYQCYNPSSSGAAHVFRWVDDQWIEETALTASDSDQNFFGFSVAIASSTILVGSPHLSLFDDSAYVYRFEDGSWFEDGKLTHPEGESFGWSVALSEVAAAIGDNSDDGGCMSCGNCNSGAVHFVDLSDCSAPFIRGDGNGDGLIGIADPVFNLDYLFGGGPSICLDAQDTNDDGALDLVDPIFGLSYQFSGGPPPPPPFPGCGGDASDDALVCEDPVGCP